MLELDATVIISDARRPTSCGSSQLDTAEMLDVRPTWNVSDVSP